MQIDSPYAKYPQTVDEFVIEAHQLFENHGEYCTPYVVHGQDAILFENFVSSPTNSRVLEGEVRPADCQHQSPMMCLYVLWEVMLTMKREGKTKVYWRMRPRIERAKHQTHPYYGVMRVAFR